MKKAENNKLFDSVFTKKYLVIKLLKLASSNIENSFNLFSNISTFQCLRL